jgi:hypothetical protein
MCAAIGVNAINHEAPTLDRTHRVDREVGLEHGIGRVGHCGRMRLRVGLYSGRSAELVLLRPISLWYKPADEALGKQDGLGSFKMLFGAGSLMVGLRGLQLHGVYTAYQPGAARVPPRIEPFLSGHSLWF